MALVEYQDWRSFIKDKWLLWDTCSINDVMHFDAESIFDDLERLGVTNCYIHPVQLELLATNNQALRFARSALLSSKFIELRLSDKTVERARIVQQALSASVQPSIADLYLAGTLASFAQGKVVLLSRNVKDFRDPIFRRECYITLEGPNNTVSIAFITVDLSQLPLP